jgi:hypothetical protein
LPSTKINWRKSSPVSLGAQNDFVAAARTDLLEAGPAVAREFCFIVPDGTRVFGSSLSAALSRARMEVGAARDGTFENLV